MCECGLLLVSTELHHDLWTGMLPRWRIINIPSRDEVMMLSSWNPSQQIGSSPTILDCYSLVRSQPKAVCTYHDRRQQSCPCPRFNGVAHSLITIAICVFGFLRIGPHTIACAVGSVAIEMLRPTHNETCPLPSVGLVLLTLA